MQTTSEAFSREYAQAITLPLASKPDTPRFLITLDVGIGDAVAVGLSAVDQIIKNDPAAYGTIDVLYNKLQAEVFTYDPKGRDLFDHISPEQVTKAIVNQVYPV